MPKPVVSSCSSDLQRPRLGRGTGAATVGSSGHLEAEPLRPRRLHAGGRVTLLGRLRPRRRRPGAAASCRAGAPGLERAQPLHQPHAAIRGADRLQPRPLPGDAQRRLLGGEGGGPEDARGHRRDLPLWRSSRRQSRPARAVLARAALRARGEEEEEEEERRLEAGIRENAKLPRPGEVRRSRPPPDQHQRGGGGARPSTRTTPPARTWIGSCACCAAPRRRDGLPGRHPLWATESWWDSNPPNPAGAPLGSMRAGPSRRCTWRGRTAPVSSSTC